ncbi:MAG: hypothetical protein ACI89L_000508 [Phycisphaerales bacterium]|jgi:hypothetical protein
MNPLTQDLLNELTVDALARTAFVIAEAVDADEATELPAATCFARIEYSGPTTGWVGFAASEGFVRELAASLLGEEAKDIDMKVEGADAFRELANIVGGSVILALGGDERNLSLGLPEEVEPTGMPSTERAGIRCFFEAEFERLEVIWAPAEQAKAAA